MIEYSLQSALNAIAREELRNLADYDYISARINFRLKLREQFYWSALQAVEKYLKAILLFNGQSTLKLSHKLKCTYGRIQQNTDVPLLLDGKQLIFYKPSKNLVITATTHGIRECLVMNYFS